MRFSWLSRQKLARKIFDGNRTAASHTIQFQTPPWRSDSKICRARARRGIFEYLRAGDLFLRRIYGLQKGTPFELTFEMPEEVGQKPASEWHSTGSCCSQTKEKRSVRRILHTRILLRNLLSERRATFTTFTTVTSGAPFEALGPAKMSLSRCKRPHRNAGSE